MKIARRIRGCGTALVTPFDSQCRPDLSAYRRLIRWQIESGIHFLVPCGTTGESATLNDKEYSQVVHCCVEEAGAAVPVLAGAGTNDTEHAARLAKIAEQAGAGAILSVTPYYNKPTQEGLFRHFERIAGSVDIPVILYNVPGRTGTNMRPQTVSRLSRIDNVIGIKEASGDLDQVMEILSDRGHDFIVLSGDDSLSFSVTALGGDGVISVASNLIPSEMSRMISALFKGDLDEARRLHFSFLRLMQLNFLESNPIPVKYALHRMGLIQETYRLPLCRLSDEHKRTMDRELDRLKLAGAYA